MVLHKKKPKMREYISRKIGKKPGKVWKDIAWRITRPRQRLAEVNIGKINAMTEKGDTIVVPGKVLGNGDIDHPVTVGAVWFSNTAKEKIEKAGGKCLSLEEIAEKNPEGKKVKIIG